MNMRINFKQIDSQTLILRLNSLRGLFAIMIVIGHCSMGFERELLPLWIIHKFNMVSVCFFFFVSGMSLSQNVERRKDYFTGFIKNKIFLLILFALITELVGRGLKLAILSQKFSFDLGIVTNWN